MNNFFNLKRKTRDLTIRHHRRPVCRVRVIPCAVRQRRFLVTAWFTLVMQFIFPLSLSFSPAFAAATPNVVATEPYVLGPDETVNAIAQRQHLTLQQLKTLNQFRTFARPFDQLGAGDEIDIPLAAAQSAAVAVDKPLFSAAEPVKPHQRNQPGTGHSAAFSAVSADPSHAGSAAGMARSAASGKISEAAGDWLGQFGTARLQLNVNNDFHLDGSALDMLIPLYDRPHEMLFTQVGARNKDSRTTVNLGVGARTWQDDWMLGLNTFYDYDLTGKNRRMGFGAEAWRDYLKLSANHYFRLSDWRQSRDFADYDERPANGYDLRAEAYLPAYPQLGGKLMFEQYRGDQVALFGKDNRQKDPYAVTLGLNYTPINLITVGADYRQGKGSLNDTLVNLQLNYRFGDSWQAQISPSAVAATRTLAGSRYDLVERNNDIVLEYRKQQLIKLALPEQLTGHAGGTGTLTAQVTSKYALDRVEWDSAALTAAGGAVSQAGQNVLTITFPAYRSGAGAMNSYEIGAIAYDSNHNASNRATTRITVLPSESNVTLTVIEDNAPVGGIEKNRVQARVADAAGNALADQVINFSADNGAVITPTTATTDGDGLAAAALTNMSAGITNVTATLANGQHHTMATHFGAATVVSIASMEATLNNQPANGAAQNEVTVVVHNGSGQPLANQEVAFNVTSGAAVLAATSISTDADGKAVAKLTSATGGSSTVKAQLGNGAYQTVNVVFTQTVAIASITVTLDNAVANDRDINEAQVKVTDSLGNALPDQPITLAPGDGLAGTLTVIEPTLTTDNQGIATFRYSYTRNGAVTIKASAQGGGDMLTDSGGTFSSPMYQLDLINHSAPADGQSPIEATLTLTNRRGDPIQNERIQTSVKQLMGGFVDFDGAVIAAPSSITNQDGQISVAATSEEEGNNLYFAFHLPAINSGVNIIPLDNTAFDFD